MPRGIRETFLVPEPVTRQVVVLHETPQGVVCSNHDIDETFTYVPHLEIVRVKRVCSTCGWIGVRVVPEDS